MTENFTAGTGMKKKLSAGMLREWE